MLVLVRAVYSVGLVVACSFLLVAQSKAQNNLDLSTVPSGLGMAIELQIACGAPQKDRTAAREVVKRTQAEMVAKLGPQVKQAFEDQYRDGMTFAKEMLGGVSAARKKEMCPQLLKDIRVHLNGPAGG